MQPQYAYSINDTVLAKIILTVLDILYNLIKRFPDASVDILHSILNYATMFNHLLSSSNLFFPMDTMFIIFGMIVAIEIAVNTALGIVYLYRLIPFI